jgi:hypothetical protein
MWLSLFSDRAIKLGIHLQPAHVGKEFGVVAGFLDVCDEQFHRFDRRQSFGFLRVTLSGTAIAAAACAS